MGFFISGRNRDEPDTEFLKFLISGRIRISGFCTKRPDIRLFCRIIWPDNEILVSGLIRISCFCTKRPDIRPDNRLFCKIIWPDNEILVSGRIRISGFCPKWPDIRPNSRHTGYPGTSLVFTDFIIKTFFNMLITLSKIQLRRNNIYWSNIRISEHSYP